MIALAAWDWPAFSGGGVAALLATLAQGCVETGEPVTVWTRGGGQRSRALAEAAPIPGVTVVGLPGRSWRRRGEAHWARGVRRELRRGAPSRVVVGSMDALPGVVQGLGGAAPVQCIAHGRDITGTLPPDRDEARARALALPGVQWLSLTEWMRGELIARGVPADRVLVVPAAVPAPRAGALNREPRAVRNLLTVGRLIPRKGHDVLLDAMPALLDGRSDLHLHIVGDGPEADALEERVARLGLEPHVTLHGPLPGDALEAAWAAADLFVMPCREERGGDTEGYGLVFLEAAARGLVSVGGATAGATEAVRAVDGALIPDPRAPRSVAQTLAPLLCDAAGTLARGARARQRWEQTGRPVHLARAVLASGSP